MIRLVSLRKIQERRRGKKKDARALYFSPLILANILRLSTSSLGSSRKKKESKKERKKKEKERERNEGMEDRSIAGSTNGKEMMHYPRNEHGRPAHSYLGFLLITATPDICISPERSSLFVRVRTRLRRRLRTMRDRDVDKPREKIASSEHRVASFSSRIWFAPPPDPGATVRSRNLQFHLFFPPRSISFKTPPRRRNVYQLVLAPPIFFLSLSFLFFSASLRLSSSPISAWLASNIRPGGTNYRPVSHEAAKSISAYT